MSISVIKSSPVNKNSFNAEICFMGKTWALFLYSEETGKEYPFNSIFKIDSKEEAVTIAKDYVPLERIKLNEKNFKTKQGID